MALDRLIHLVLLLTYGPLATVGMGWHGVIDCHDCLAHHCQSESQLDRGETDSCALCQHLAVDDVDFSVASWVDRSTPQSLPHLINHLSIRHWILRLLGPRAPPRL